MGNTTVATVPGPSSVAADCKVSASRPRTATWAPSLRNALAMARPIPLSNVMRADEPGPTLDREEVLEAAPVVEDHQFRVPPSLGEES